MSKIKNLRIGVLGTGFGRTHARNFLSFEDVEVTGIFGREKTKTLEIARSLGVAGFTETKALLENENVDAVVVCLPTPLHAETVTAALKAGKDVFCEIPAAYTLAEARLMHKTAAETGRKLLIAHYSRFVSDYKTIVDYAAEGRLGKLKSLYASRRTAPVWGDGWDENFIHDLMLHDIDYAVWMLGRPLAVAGRGLGLGKGGWEYVCISLEYPDSLVVIEGSGILPVSFPFSTTLRVAGSQGAMDLDWAWGDKGPLSVLKYYPAEGEVLTLPVKGQDPYLAEDRYFVDCLQGKADPAFLSLENVLASLEVACAARQSLEQGGKRVSI